MKKRMIAVVCVFALTLPLGCLSGGHQLRVIPSPGVETIPTTIGIHPFLSVSTSTRLSRTSSEALSHRTTNKDVYIIPPVGSQMVVTPFSQLFTGLVSVEMASYGFDLRELPVEIPKRDNVIGQSKNEFVISRLGARTYGRPGPSGDG